VRFNLGDNIVTFQNLQCHNSFHQLNYLAKDNVLSVQPSGLDSCNEELRSIGCKFQFSFCKVANFYYFFLRWPWKATQVWCASAWSFRHQICLRKCFLPQFRHLLLLHSAFSVNTVGEVSSLDHKVGNDSGVN
jgi:hypothetical protein